MGIELSDVHQIARSFDSLENLFALLEEFCREHRVGERSAFVLQMAVEELFTNFVKYNDGDQPVTFLLGRESDRVFFELTDHGVSSFDPLTDAPDPEVDRPTEERTPGGLGLHLIKRMATDFSYRYHDGAMTVRVEQTV